MQAPRFKWEWNLNTAAILVGFASGFVAWGWTLSEMQTGRTINATNIERIEVRLTRIENDSRRIDNHELRISNVERHADNAAASMKTVESAVSSLSSDIRLVREILQRIEEAQKNRPVD